MPTDIPAPPADIPAPPADSPAPPALRVAPDGIVVVAKPAGMTSHDVVARVRRILRTRKVGHAGTLDPAATGVLVVGVGRATRLLGHLSGDDKEYRAVIRLGAATTTDDAEGEVLERAEADAHAVVGALDALIDERVREQARTLTGEIRQVPPAVSAVKVAGRRAYARARAGEDVVLAPRTVRVDRFDVHDVRRGPHHVDVVATVVCSAGTYIRSLARDMGEALGVGGHLVALERTRSGSFVLEEARTLAELEDDPYVVPLATVLAREFPVRRVDSDEARRLAYGQILSATGVDGTVAALDREGRAVALVRDEDRAAGPGARPVVVFVAPL